MLFTRFADPRLAPFRALRGLQAELERLHADAGLARTPAPFAVYHREDALLLRTPLPGVDPAAITLELDGDELTLTGRFREPAGVENAVAKHVERPRGAFRRTLRLPFEADTAHVEARFEHGVLEIRVPRSPKAAPVKIAVQSTEPRS